MKYFSNRASHEVATNSRFLQNAACHSRLIWNKHMLYLMVSMLCASCGSSGAPTDTESTPALQTSQSVVSSSAPDTIIGPGFSGYSVAEAQVPTIAAAQEQATSVATQEQVAQAPATSVAAAVQSLASAPGQPVSSASKLVGSAVTVEEPPSAAIIEEVPEESPVVVTVEESPSEPVEEQPEIAAASESQETSMSPEAAIELAALEADLAELAQSETSSEPEPNGVGEGTEIVSDTYRYESIKANGLGNGTYPTDDYYLAEFLYQNPDVCFWEQDSENKTITSLKTPVPPENSVYMPSPSGGDDTAMLESFIKKNAGKSLVGQGTYKVATLDINHAVDIFNMAMVPASGAKQMVRVNVADVRIFNSPIDGQNMPSLAIGFNVEDGAHRFVLVNSGVKNIYHKRDANAAAVFIRGANDFYIVCNRFDDILNTTNDKTKTARANSFWLSGRKVHNLSGGLIANNDASNHQSNGKLKDAEFFTIQGYNSISEKNPLRIFANRTVNAGKRFTKNQEGSTVILSNYVEWNTKTGPLGRRTLIAPFVIHLSDNITIRNNRVSISAEGSFEAVLITDASSGAHTAHLGGNIQNNIHFDNNDIELKDNRDPSARGGPALVIARASNRPENDVGYEAKNSSASNNNVYGTGSLRTYFTFGSGYADNGGRFDHSGNVFSVPFYGKEYF